MVTLLNKMDKILKPLRDKSAKVLYLVKIFNNLSKKSTNYLKIVHNSNKLC